MAGVQLASLKFGVYLPHISPETILRGVLCLLHQTLLGTFAVCQGHTSEVDIWSGGGFDYFLCEKREIWEATEPKRQCHFCAT